MAPTRPSRNSTSRWIRASARSDQGVPVRTGAQPSCGPSVLFLTFTEESSMPIPNRALVLVVDGRKMLFFRNEGDTNQIDLRTEAHEERDDAHHDGDLKTDAPGSSASSVGSAR